VPNSNADSINGEKKEQAAQAFHFAPFLTAVNQGGQIEKAGKSRHFCFDENGEKLKKLEKSLVLTFSR